ncbi:hypothetical protein K1719_042073 [Acacia pycnantha]|nr:hypothetical protein K1719_042073 [Acacia pycnantha]
MMRIILYPQTDRWVSSDTNSSIIVLRNKGYPSFMSSWSSTCQVVAILDLWSKRGTGKYKEKVYDLPEHLEEKVSSLHLANLAKLTKTTNEETIGQADDHVLTNREAP